MNMKIKEVPMKRYKYNNRGFSHHFIFPILAILAVSAIGFLTLNLSSAASNKFTVARCDSTPLGRGSSGYCVKVLQKVLNKTRSNDLRVDGLFGDGTKAAVKTFQRSPNYGGAIKADGVVGSSTWGKIKKVPGASSVVIIKPATTAQKKAACNAKYGYVWSASSCKYMKKVCVDNDGKWNDKTKKCAAKNETKTVYMKSCLKGYVNRPDNGECVKPGVGCKTNMLYNSDNGKWSTGGKCIANSN